MGRDRDRPPAGQAPEEATLAQRREFCRFTDEDCELLAELGPVFERESPAVVEEFYAHLMRFPPLRRLLRDSDSVERLKGFQADYLISLTRGPQAEDYAADRLRIGHVHERIGLAPQWYLGTYGLYLDLLLPHVNEHFASDPDRATRAGSALSKLFILDMQLILDAYYEMRQQRVVERSEHLAEVGELAASIAHEVRNPLAGMKGALEVMRRDLSANPAYEEVLGELVAQIERLEGLVRDLLTYARPSPVSRQHFDLHELLDRVLRYFSEPFDGSGIELQRAYDRAGSGVHADPQQMEQIFLNLIQNAAQAMDRGGRLTLVTAFDGPDVEVSFADTGRGITAEVRAQIFQPFFTTKHRGSGLGLPIVRKIVEAHDGTVTVDSAPGSGTTVRVRLPGAVRD